MRYWKQLVTQFYLFEVILIPIKTRLSAMCCLRTSHRNTLEQHAHLLIFIWMVFYAAPKNISLIRRQLTLWWERSGIHFKIRKNQLSWMGRSAKHHTNLTSLCVAGVAFNFARVEPAARNRSHLCTALFSRSSFFYLLALEFMRKFTRQQLAFGERLQ